MSCNCNKPTNIPCGCESCEDTNPGCSCPIKDLSTDCVLYTGDRLECSGIETNTILTNLIVQLDKFICDKFNNIIKYLSLTNVGNGVEVYRGISGTGEKELRTIKADDNSFMDVIESIDTIDLLPGKYDLIINGTNLELNVTTNSGTQVVATIPLDDIGGTGSDTFAAAATFNSTNQELTVSMNNIANHLVDLSFLNNHLESVVYNSGTNTVNFTIIDGTVFPLDMTPFLSSGSVQSNYLESDNTDPSFIQNKNPNKTITSNYTLTSVDNNYVIEIDGTVSNTPIQIDLSALTETSNYFVGFVKKGDKQSPVTFVGQDSVPVDLLPEIYGDGHMVAVEIINGTKYLLGSLKPV